MGGLEFWAALYQQPQLHTSTGFVLSRGTNLGYAWRLLNLAMPVWPSLTTLTLTLYRSFCGFSLVLTLLRRSNTSGFHPELSIVNIQKKPFCYPDKFSENCSVAALLLFTVHRQGWVLVDIELFNHTN